MKKIILICLILFPTIVNSQWVKVSNGIGNVDVFSLAYGGNYIFAGKYGSVSISTNNGTNWTQSSFYNQTVWSILVNGNNTFAGTGGSPLFGIYFSTNNGTTWSQSLNNLSVFSFAVNGNYVFAGTAYSGVYLSTNNGVTWSLSSLNNRSVYSLVVSGNNIFAGTDVIGIYLSTNNGTTWTQTSLNNRTVYSMTLNGSNIFAGTYSQGYGIYLSTNNGANWTQTSLNNQDILSLAANVNNIFAGTYYNGVYVSNDNGITWVQRNEGFPDSARVYSLCIANNYIFAGTDSSVYRRQLSEFVGIQPISSDIPKEYSLSQNYPNPFNPSTKIKFDIPKQSLTKISVFDVLGGEVVTLVNEELNAGKYEVEFNAAKCSSGLYFYRIESRDYVEVKKMILVK